MSSWWPEGLHLLCLPENQKVCTSFDMAPLTAMPSASVLNHASENLPLLTAMANALSKSICSCLLKLSIKMSWHPIERQYSSHLAHARDLSSYVPPVTACSRVSAVVAKSAKIWSCWAAEISWNASASVVENGDGCWGEFFVVLVPIQETAAVAFFNFNFQANHWLYPSISSSVNKRAWWRVVSVWTLAWVVGSWPTSLKFDFCTHPLAVMLSVIDRTQSPCSRWLTSTSIQGVVMDVKYLSKFLVTWNCRWTGTWKHPCVPLIAVSSEP